MSAEDLEWVTETLVEAERRRCVSRVRSVETEDAVAKGDNYGSDMRRLKLSVVLHSGEVQQRSLIYKAMPDTPHRRQALKMFGTFAKEAKVYYDVLHEVEAILREKEVNAELLWPEFYGAKRRYEGLLFEDLCEKGFKMADRQKGMDFEHATLAVRYLGKFHALVAVLRERGDLHIKDYEMLFNLNDSDFMENYFQNTFEDFAKVLETKWKGEWAQYGEKVRKAGKKCSNLKEIMKRGNGEKFYTLNHGDCWVNNMMFRYDRKGTPEAVKFIDFQLCHYNHPGFDLQYFFQTSLNLEARPRKTELLQEYHSSLEENLKIFGYGGAVPTYEEILGYYKSAEYYGLVVGIGSTPFMLASSDKAPDMEDFTEKLMNKENVAVSAFDSVGEIIINTLKYILKEADENGLL